METIRQHYNETTVPTPFPVLPILHTPEIPNSNSLVTFIPSCCIWTRAAAGNRHRAGSPSDTNIQVSLQEESSVHCHLRCKIENGKSLSPPRVLHPGGMLHHVLHKVKHAYNSSHVNCFFPQLHDYAISMKTDDFAASHRLSKELLHVLIQLEQAEYSRATMCNLMVMSYHQKIDSAAWRTLSQKSSLMNEEGGEMYLSMFGRHMNTNPRRTRFASSEQYFKTLPKLWEDAKRFETDMEVEGHLMRYPTTFAENHEGVTNTEDVVIEILEELSDSMRDTYETRNSEDALRCKVCEAKELKVRRCKLNRSKVDLAMNRKLIVRKLKRLGASVTAALETAWPQNECLPHWPLDEKDIERNYDLRDLRDVAQEAKWRELVRTTHALAQCISASCNVNILTSIILCSLCN